MLVQSNELFTYNFTKELTMNIHELTNSQLKTISGTNPEYMAATRSTDVPKEIMNLLSL